MSGRMEHDRAYETKTKKRLAGMPDILTKYFEEGSGNQMSCKSKWTSRAILFYEWAVENKGYDLSKDSEWARITRSDIKDYFRDARIKVPASETPDGEPVYKEISTMGTIYTIIKSLFNYLVSEEIIEKSPVPTKREIEKIIGKEDKTFRPVAMTPSEVNTVRESISVSSKYPARDICLFVLGCRTGLRATALSEIDIDDISFGEKTLYVIEKGNYTREIYLDDDTIGLINRCIEERQEIIARCKDESRRHCDALFISNYRGISRVSVDHIAKVIRLNTQMLDKHITPHKMRSTCVTTVYNMTNDINEAADQAGHRNLSNTKRYIDAKDRRQKRAERLAKLY